MKKLVLCLFTISSATFSLNAQSLDHVLGDLLVRTVEGQKIESVIADHELFEGTATKISIVKAVSKSMNIWLLHFDHTIIHEQDFLSRLQANPKVHTAQLNHLVSMRETIPDDPLFDEQWQYVNIGQNGGLPDADIDADLAWDISTGGVTANGDTIVVAVLDGAFNLAHEDFEDNLWVNRAEIPNNDIDDDNNGYIDDYLGFNVAQENDDIDFVDGAHATPVAGIIGANGNNGIGVSGINWDIKLMMIRINLTFASEAQIITGYSYALDARRKYNQTNGEEGAFVVSTNASFGLSYTFPEDAPLWCAIYDTLGYAGILNCGATINDGIDVGEFGDLPTTCPSDFLISVTNIDRGDNRVAAAGFGLEHIDLGAPGQSAYTTNSGNSYGVFDGTSSATPHVTGAVALIYANPCTNLSQIALAEPQLAARLAKDYILEGVDPNASLSGITVTGGRLNVNNSMMLVVDDCEPCPPPVNLSVDMLSTNTASLHWTPLSSATSTSLRWKQIDVEEWTNVNDISAPYMLENLLTCTDYEFQVSATCDTINSAYSPSLIFQTEGCCFSPNGLMISNVTNETATFNWNGLATAQSYNVLLSSNSGTTLYEQVESTSLDVFDLNPCETYTVSVQTNCADSTTMFGNVQSFTTFGCGACLDQVYCESWSDNVSIEWIESIQVGELTNTSGPGEGYSDFSSVNTPTFMTYAPYPISLTPGFAGFNFLENFRIWIDFNQDGTFSQENELVFDQLMGASETVNSTIVIAGDAVPGLTRMRISMTWAGDYGSENFPVQCGNIGGGEVEDYCINIVPGEPLPCNVVTNLDTSSVDFNSAILTWMDTSVNTLSHNLRIKATSVTDWTEYLDISAPFEVDGLEECVDYEFQVQTNCVGDINSSAYSESREFSTACLMTSSTEIDRPFELVVLPNPFKKELAITINSSFIGDAQISLIDLNGRVLQLSQANLFAGSQQFVFNDLDKLSSGIYFVQIQTESATYNQKVVKLN